MNEVLKEQKEEHKYNNIMQEFVQNKSFNTIYPDLGFEKFNVVKWWE